MFNAADRKSVRKAEKAANLAARLSADFVVAAMSTQPGRAWFWAKLGRCKVFHSSFTGEALSSAFAEGERAVGLEILAEIMANCPEQYVLMAQEATQREIIANAERTDRESADESDDTGAGEYSGSEES